MGDTSIDMPSVLVALVPKEEMIRTLSNKSQKSSSSMEDVTRTKVCKVKPQETTSSMCLKSEESNLNSPAEKDTQDLRVDSTSSCQQDSKIGASESNGTSSAEVIGPNSCNGENETSTSQESENCLKEHQDNNLPSIPSNNNNNNNRESTELSFENNGAKILKDVSSAQNSEEKKNAFLSLYRLRSDAEPGVCLICNKSQKEEPRAMVRFLPNPPDATEDITVHVFCGKTVAILPAATEKNEDLANYEIILKAGLKHKHGIGSKIDLAISRSRCALARGGEADNDSKRESKEYFLVQEFESHLKNIQEANGDEHVEVNGNRAKGRPRKGQPASYYNDICGKSVAKKIKNKKDTKYSNKKKSQEWIYVHDPFTTQGAATSSNAAITPDGKILCPCGGSYLPSSIPGGLNSWKRHAKTSKHTKYIKRLNHTTHTVTLRNLMPVTHNENV